MIIHLNGWPGVGKLSVARLLAHRLHGRVLDNHSIYNVAFALTEFRTPEFYETVRRVRAVAFDRVVQIDRKIPVILTDALTSGEWGQETREVIHQLALRRGSRLLSIRLDCSPDEHSKRLRSEERAYLGKLTDVAAMRFMRDGMELIDCACPTFFLDTTFLTPDLVTDQISAQLRHL